jgi:HD-GYP domain-containing protein (c-di-GMP phosphodiesterase class II)
MASFADVKREVKVTLAEAAQETSEESPSENEAPLPETQEEPPSQEMASFADVKREVNVDFAKIMQKMQEEPSPESKEAPPSETQEEPPSQEMESFADVKPEVNVDFAEISHNILEEPSPETKERSPSEMEEEPLPQSEVGIDETMQEVLEGRPLTIDLEKGGEIPATGDIPKEFKHEEGEVFSLYYNVVELARGIICNIEEKKPINVEDLDREMSQVLDKVLLGSQELLILSTETKKTNIGRGELYARHLANVSIISMTIGASLGYEKSELLTLGGAALLHDVGLLKLKPITSFKGGLDNKAVKHLRKHPKYGAKIVKKLRLPRPYIQTVLQHHEREDGSGYPSGLKGDKIHEHAKIVGLADIIESLGENKHYHKAVSSSDAQKWVEENWKDAFGPKIVGALAATWGVLPAETLSALSSRIVVEAKKQDLTPTDSERSWAASKLNHLK